MAGLMTPSLGSFVTVEPGRRQPDLAGAYTSGFKEGFTSEVERNVYDAVMRREADRRRMQELAAPEDFGREKTGEVPMPRPSPLAADMNRPAKISIGLGTPSAVPVPRPRPANIDIPGYSVPVPPMRPPAPYTEDRVAYLQPLYDMGVDARELHQMIAGESKWDPAAKGSGTASGLFQFVESAALDLGTTPDAIRAMPPEDQVALYVRYLQWWGWEPGIPLALMQAAPAYARRLAGRPDTAVVFPVNSKEWLANPGWRSAGGSGPVTKGSLKQYYAGQSATLPRYETGGMVGPGGQPVRPEVDPMFESGLGRQIGLTGRYMAEGIGDVAGLLYDPVAGAINYATGTDIQPLGTQVRAGLQNLGFPQPVSGTEQFVAPVARGVVGAAVPGGAGLRYGRPLLTSATVGTPAVLGGAVARAEDTTPVPIPRPRPSGVGEAGLPPTDLPQEAQFDFSRRKQALAEKEDYLRRAMYFMAAGNLIGKDYSNFAAMEAEYAKLGNERALVAGIESLQAAAMGNITPLRQFLADQYGTGDVQIYQNTDGTLDIEVNGRSLGRTTLGAIRQQLLADLDPATQQATAAATKYQQELFLKLAPEMLKQQYARDELKNLKFADLGLGKSFFTYIRGNESFMRPLVEVTVGDQTVYKLGEEQPFSGVR